MKTSRQKVLDVFNHRGTGEGVMWTGNPDWEIVEAASEKWGIERSNEALFRFFDDDCRWISADRGYKHPEGLAAIDTDYGLPPERPFLLKVVLPTRKRLPRSMPIPGPM